jgi:methylmalonyl-CoA mutase
MSGKLFSAFTATDKAAWQRQADKETKGAIHELNRIKISESDSIDPYVTFPELDHAAVKDLQNSQKKIPGWLNMPLIKSKGENTNFKIHNALQAGAQAVLLEMKDSDSDNNQFYKLLDGIRLSDTPVYIKTSQNPVSVFNAISKGAGYYLKGGIANDPLAHWMRTGDSYDQSIANIAELLNITGDMREFRPLMVESHLFQRSGATVVQELAAITGTMVCYLDQLTDLGIPAQQVVNRLFFSVSVGTEYLTEIAKLRALRYLYTKVCRGYELPEALCSAYIHAETSSFYESAAVPHTNMIRATSEAMSAVTGGCDALTVHRYSESLPDTDNFPERIALNVSSLIANESYLSQVADPAAGSFFIENLSLKIADAAWSLFLQWEETGSIIQAFKEGLIQDDIEKSCQAKIAELQNGRVMIGVNKFNEEGLDGNYPQSSAVIDKKERNGLRLLTERNLAEEWTKYAFPGKH